MNYVKNNIESTVKTMWKHRLKEKLSYSVVIFSCSFTDWQKYDEHVLSTVS